MRVCDIEGCGNPHNSHGLCTTHGRRQRLYGSPYVTRMRPTGQSLEEAFRWYMPDDPPTEGCWEWQGPMGGTYGTIHAEGGSYGAHVAAHMLFIGEVPKGSVVRHDCDNPRCVQPKHLRVGTHADNQADKVERNRQAKGQRVNTARLTEDDVRDILKRRSEGPTALATEYGITKAAVGHILTGRNWRHVER